MGALGLLCLSFAAITNGDKLDYNGAPLNLLRPVKSHDTNEDATEGPSREEQAKAAMAEMDAVMTEMTHNMTLVDWEYNTNVNDDTEAASAAYATYWSVQYKEWWTKTIQKYI